MARMINWPRWLRTIASIAALTIFVLAPLAYVTPDAASAQSMYNQFIFYPTRVPKGFSDYRAVENIHPESVTFKSESKNTLHGLLYINEVATRTVLLSHGNAYSCGDRSPVVEKLLSAGASVFIYDYSGYGQSTGKPSMGGICKDGAAALQYLTDVKNIPPANIVLCGESLGTLVAGRLAANSKCAGLIMICPILSLRRVGGDMSPIIRKAPGLFFSATCKKLENIGPLKNNEIPKLFIAGTADRVTRIKQADELVHEVAEPKIYLRIDGAGHVDGAMVADRQFTKTIADFLASI